MGILLVLAGLLVLHQGGTFWDAWGERQALFAQMLAIREATGKPTLVVGRPTLQNVEYDCGPDVTLDLDPAVLETCPLSGVIGDVRSLPYRTRQFSAVFVSHVLEHVGRIEDVAAAWGELHRVADVVLIAYPKRDALVSWLNPDHKTMTEPLDQSRLRVEELIAPNRTAIVYHDGSYEFVEGK